jgi:diguanylate cyclase (GGDEF)-like protein
MYGSAPDLVTIDLANAVLFTSYAVTWTGARVFDGRPAEPVYLVTGAVLWLLICRLPGLSDSLALRVLLASGIIASYTWLTAFEFWRGRAEALVSRWPAIFMLFAHGALFLLRTPLVAVLPWLSTNDIYGSVWLTVLSFEALLFTISIAFILLAMAKERTELRHKTAAMIDPLTGLPNRRSFMEEAARLTERHRSHPKPVTVLLMDMDHFKSINDRFGHAIGDQVLEVFAETVRQSVRSSDLISRLGGEEFAAVLYDISREKAFAVADRIRTSFAQAALEVDDHPIAATVSIGLAHCELEAFELGELLAQADRALYVAKERGRNRVETASLALYRGEDERPAAASALAASTHSTAA